MVWARQHHEYDSAGQILVLLIDSSIRRWSLSTMSLACLYDVIGFCVLCNWSVSTMSLIHRYDVTGLYVLCYWTLCSVLLVFAYDVTVLSV